MERRLLDMGFPKGVKRDFAALEKRRIEAVRLVVKEGLSQAGAARRVQAAQQSVSGWVQRYREDGRAGLAKAGRAGRKPLLSTAQLAELEGLLLETRSARLPDAAVELSAGGAVDPRPFRGALPRRPRLEAAAGTPLEPATAGRQGPRAQRGSDPRLEETDLARH